MTATTNYHKDHENHHKDIHGDEEEEKLHKKLVLVLMLAHLDRLSVLPYAGFSLM